MKKIYILLAGLLLTGAALKAQDTVRLQTNLNFHS